MIWVSICLSLCLFPSASSPIYSKFLVLQRRLLVSLSLQGLCYLFGIEFSALDSKKKCNRSSSSIVLLLFYISSLYLQDVFRYIISHLCAHPVKVKMYVEFDDEWRWPGRTTIPPVGSAQLSTAARCGQHHLKSASMSFRPGLSTITLYRKLLYLANKWPSCSEV